LERRKGLGGASINIKKKEDPVVFCSLSDESREGDRSIVAVYRANRKQMTLEGKWLDGSWKIHPHKKKGKRERSLYL